jgi:hypothetical protein
MDKEMKKLIERAKLHARAQALEARLMEHLVDRYVQLRIYRDIWGG